MTGSRDTATRFTTAVGEAMPPKIIQIAAIPDAPASHARVFALDDQGGMWVQVAGIDQPWVRMPNLPADEAQEQSVLDAELEFCERQEREGAWQELAQAVRDMRDAVLHERFQLAEMNAGSDIINSVLGIIDDHTVDLIAEVPAPEGKEVISICSAHQTQVEGCPRCNVEVASPPSPIAAGVEAGEGWRLLEKGELVQEGDEFFGDYGWCRSENWNTTSGRQDDFPYRRRVPTHREAECARILEEAMKHPGVNDIQAMYVQSLSSIEPSPPHRAFASAAETNERVSRYVKAQATNITQHGSLSEFERGMLSVLRKVAQLLAPCVREAGK